MLRGLADRPMLVLDTGKSHTFPELQAARESYGRELALAVARASAVVEAAFHAAAAAVAALRAAPAPSGSFASKTTGMGVVRQALLAHAQAMKEVGGGAEPR